MISSPMEREEVLIHREAGDIDHRLHHIPSFALNRLYSNLAEVKLRNHYGGEPFNTIYHSQSATLILLIKNHN